MFPGYLAGLNPRGSRATLVRDEREKSIRKAMGVGVMIFKPPEETGDRHNHFQRTA